jgi:hypothetical protein
VVGKITNDDVSSSSSYTLAANQSSLVLLGSAAINGTGNALDNIITGNVNNNRLSGLGGTDTLTGGGGSKDRDVFAYTRLNESLLGTGSAFDQITDFNSNDRLLAPASVIKAKLTSSRGTIDSLTAPSIAGLLTSQNWLAQSVAAFTVTGRTGTFIAMNDGRAGFQADSDAIVFLRGYQVSSANSVDFG